MLETNKPNAELFLETQVHFQTNQGKRKWENDNQNFQDQQFRKSFADTIELNNGVEIKNGEKNSDVNFFHYPQTKSRHHYDKISNSLQTGEKENANTTLYITNLPHDISENHLMEKFKKFGNILRIYLSKNNRIEIPYIYAFITFQTKSQRKYALKEMNESELDGKIIRVEKAKREGPRKSYHFEEFHSHEKRRMNSLSEITNSHPNYSHRNKSKKCLNYKQEKFTDYERRYFDPKNDPSDKEDSSIKNSKEIESVNSLNRSRSRSSSRKPIYFKRNFKNS